MVKQSQLGLDFAPRSPWRKATVACMVFGVLASIAVLWHRHHLLEQRAHAMSQLDALQRPATGAMSSRPTTARREAVDEADRLVASLQRPWEPMLNALRAALKDDVIVNRVQPETDAFRLRITGQADSSQAFVEFVQRLQGDALWRVVEPVSESKQVDNAAPDGKPVAFQLTAEWRRP